jgi:hypothetical protein
MRMGNLNKKNRIIRSKLMWNAFLNWTITKVVFGIMKSFILMFMRIIFLVWRGSLILILKVKRDHAVLKSQSLFCLFNSINLLFLVDIIFGGSINYFKRVTSFCWDSENSYAALYTTGLIYLLKYRFCHI